MAGFKDWIRSRSKSRSRNPRDARTARSMAEDEAPPLPPAPQSSNPPLALLRADSGYKRSREQPRTAEPNGSLNDARSSRQGRPSSGVTQGTLSIRSSQYDGVPAGAPPTQGTYPLHGNAAQTIPSPRERRTSKSSVRASTSSAARQSLPSGTAPSFDAAGPMSGYPERSSSARVLPASSTANKTASPTQIQSPGSLQNGPTIPMNGYTSKGKGKAPMVPIIPGQYRYGAMARTSGGSDPDANQRFTSTSSRESTSRSRTPIAEQVIATLNLSWCTLDRFTDILPFKFTASAWNDSRTNAPGLPGIPSFAPMAGFVPESRRILRRQPDVDDLSSEATAHSPVDIPKRESSLANRQQDSSTRGWTPRRSLEKTLPIPRELQDAPWNRSDSLPIVEPLEFGGSSKNGEVDDLAVRLPHQSLRNDQPVDGGMEDDIVHHGMGQERVPEPRDLAGSELDYSSARATPLSGNNSHDELQPSIQPEVKKGQQPVYKDGALMISNAPHQPSLKGVVDLTNTEDTSVHTRYAPVVTHEYVKPEVHHIRQEVITREIHHHDVYHRILPVIDVQVLPSKHFVPSGDGSTFVEVPADQIPGRTFDDHSSRNWVIAETVSKALAPKSAPSTEPRRFTARKFEGTDGDYREELGSDGILRTHTTWVHPPTINRVAEMRGLTVPLEMD